MVRSGALHGTTGAAAEPGGPGSPRLLLPLPGTHALVRGMLSQGKQAVPQRHTSVWKKDSRGSPDDSREAPRGRHHHRAQ